MILYNVPKPKFIKMYFHLKILAIVSFISNVGWSNFVCTDFPKARTTWSLLKKI